MITSLILGVIQSAFNTVTGVLPSGSSLGANTVSGDLQSSGIFSHVGWLNAYVPVQEATTVLLLLLTLFVVMSTLRIVLWVLTKLHVLGGSSD